MKKWLREELLVAIQEDWRTDDVIRNKQQKQKKFKKKKKEHKSGLFFFSQRNVSNFRLVTNNIQFSRILFFYQPNQGVVLRVIVHRGLYVSIDLLRWWSVFFCLSSSSRWACWSQWRCRPWCVWAASTLACTQFWWDSPTPRPHTHTHAHTHYNIKDLSSSQDLLFISVSV